MKTCCCICREWVLCCRRCGLIGYTKSLTVLTGKDDIPCSEASNIDGGDSRKANGSPMEEAPRVLKSCKVSVLGCMVALRKRATNQVPEWLGSNMRTFSVEYVPVGVILWYYTMLEQWPCKCFGKVGFYYLLLICIGFLYFFGQIFVG